jgi:hypothetical protein
MVKCGVLFEVRTEFLNIIYTSFFLKWLIALNPGVICAWSEYLRMLQGQTLSLWPTTYLKAKAVPLHAMKALGGEEYSSYSFSTSALDGGEWSASRPGRALAPGKGLPVPIVQEAGWAPDPVWTQRLDQYIPLSWKYMLSQWRAALRSFSRRIPVF